MVKAVVLRAMLLGFKSRECNTEARYLSQLEVQHRGQIFILTDHSNFCSRSRTNSEGLGVDRPKIRSYASFISQTQKKTKKYKEDRKEERKL